VRRVTFDPTAGAYVDTRATRGFPMGGMGSGGFSVATDGGFGELRLNNNWMCPIQDVRGAFHALWVRSANATETVVLSRTPRFTGVRGVRSTTFVGRLPGFVLRYDDDLPVRVALHGFTPHVPHDVVASTLPAAVFRFTLENPTAAPVDAAILFAFENVLGRGGTGYLGVELGPEQELRGVRGRIVYDDVAGNVQEEAQVAGRRGVRFRTTQSHDPRSHRTSVTGEYLLLVESAPGLDVTVCDGFDAAAERPGMLDDFAASGRLCQPTDVGMPARPSAAIAAGRTLAPGATAEIVFTLAWWTADHVTEPALARPGGEPDGVRVGHVYENHFDSVDDVAGHVLDRRAELEDASGELGRILSDSSLPRWLVRVLENAIDSTLCNTVVPASGRLYTLEGVDWHWPMGGLTGTNDQRLSAHPYTSTFFPDLDLTELDEFRRLADARGAIPHGNGNCDLGLGTTDVPYGWPMFIKDFLPAKEWTDLTMSLVIQVGKHWRTTGDHHVRERFWPALVRGLEYLDGIAPRGVPEGGTTYDIWDFPGAFAYTATLYQATLATMIDLATIADPDRVAVYRARADACARRLDADLWDARGYFRSSETTDTIFTAALAGDWAARLAGLDPVVDPTRARSHLRHAHRVLVDAAGDGALPRAEARFDGSAVAAPMAAGLPPGEEMVYVWQVLSYQAMEEIYLGDVDAGLETIRRVYDRIWGDGHAWSAGLRGNGESIYMTHPVIWSVLNAITGAALDVPGRTLHLSPRMAGRCPFFFPPFWAMCDHDPASGRTSVEVLRTFGAPVTLERVQHRAASGDVRVHAVGPVALAAGTRLDLDLRA
jgi:uncharacterized protein (DUF608 family)